MHAYRECVYCEDDVASYYKKLVCLSEPKRVVNHIFLSLQSQGTKTKMLKKLQGLANA